MHHKNGTQDGRLISHHQTELRRIGKPGRSTPRKRSNIDNMSTSCPKSKTRCCSPIRSPVIPFSKIHPALSQPYRLHHPLVRKPQQEQDYPYPPAIPCPNRFTTWAGRRFFCATSAKKSFQDEPSPFLRLAQHQTCSSPIIAAEVCLIVDSQVTADR